MTGVGWVSLVELGLGSDNRFHVMLGLGSSTAFGGFFEYGKDSEYRKKGGK